MEGSFRKDKVSDALSDVCALFDEAGLTMVERWYACLCIERGAEAVLGEGFRLAMEPIKSPSDGPSLAAVAAEIRDAQSWCDQNGERTGTVSLSSMKLGEWAEAIEGYSSNAGV